MQRSFRLKRRASFQYVYRKGARTGSQDMALISARSREGLKIGLSVSKKVGNAVVRNHVKRLLREAIGRILSQIDDRYMYVIVAYPKMAELGFEQVLSQVKEAFSAAGKLIC